MTKQDIEEEKIAPIVYYFVWLVLIPAIVVGVAISVIWPDKRPVYSNMLTSGFFMFIALLGAYWAWQWWKNKE